MGKVTGIAGKLTLGVIAFGLLLGIVCSLVGYREFTAVLERQYNDSAYEIAQTAITLLNPDKFEQYLENILRKNQIPFDIGEKIPRILDKRDCFSMTIGV